MATVTQIGPRLGIAPTCAALGLPRATYYRRRRPPRAAPPRRRSPRALGEAERAAVREPLHTPRFVDLAPGEVYATLLGELSDDVVAVLTDARDGLFPEPRELALDCSCPDGARVCKHVAAVLYGVSVRLDSRPELFFDLRCVDQAELIGSATAGAAGRPRPAAGKRIAAERLSAVFGIELEPTGPGDSGRRALRAAATRRPRPASPPRRGRPAGRAARGR